MRGTGVSRRQLNVQVDQGRLVGNSSAEIASWASKPYVFTIFAIVSWAAMVDLAWIPLDTTLVVTVISAPFILFFFLSLSCFVDAAMSALVFEEFEFCYFVLLIVLNGMLEMYRVATTYSAFTPIFNCIVFNVLMFIATLGFSCYDCVLNFNLRLHSGDV